MNMQTELIGLLSYPCLQCKHIRVFWKDFGGTAVVVLQCDKDYSVPKAQDKMRCDDFEREEEK